MGRFSETKSSSLVNENNNIGGDDNNTGAAAAAQLSLLTVKFINDAAADINFVSEGGHPSPPIYHPTPSIEVLIYLITCPHLPMIS